MRLEKCQGELFDKEIFLPYACRGEKSRNVCILIFIVIYIQIYYHCLFKHFLLLQFFLDQKFII